MWSSDTTEYLHVSSHLMYFDQMRQAMSKYAKAGNANFVVVSTGYFSFNSSVCPALLVIYNGIFQIKV